MNEALEERVFTYKLLARLVVVPADRSLLDHLKSIEVMDPNNADPLIDSWRRLTEAASSALIEELDDEFHRLFIGLGRGELLPYRSYYETGFLMEKPLAELRSDLRRLGYQRKADNNEPEDHFSSLCEVMASLVEEQNSEQVAFFKHHVAPWFQHFFNDLRQSTTDSFYQAVAALGETFIVAESNLLKSE